MDPAEQIAAKALELMRAAGVPLWVVILLAVAVGAVLVLAPGAAAAVLRVARNAPPAPPPQAERLEPDVETDERSEPTAHWCSNVEQNDHLAQPGEIGGG